MPFEVVDEAAETKKIREHAERVCQTLETFGQKKFLGNVKATANVTSWKITWTVTSQTMRKPRFSWMNYIPLLKPSSEPPITVLKMTSEKNGGSGGKFELQNFEVQIVNRDLLSTVKELAEVLALIHDSKNVKVHIVEEF